VQARKTETSLEFNRILSIGKTSQMSYLILKILNL
jgi:hypothetical protein